MVAAASDTAGVASAVRLSTFDEPVSDADIKSGAAGVAGGVESIVIGSAGLGADSLPAGSAIIAVSDQSPFDMLGKSQFVTVGEATYVHDTVEPSAFAAVIVTLLPSGTVPADTEGVVSFVRSSVLCGPRSDAGNRSGADGVVGAAVSIFNGSGAEAGEVFPAGSVVVVVIDQSPSDIVGKSQLLTVGDFTYEHDRVDPSAFVAVTSMRSPSPSPSAEMAGVLSLVRLSVVEIPVSEAEMRSGVPATVEVSILIDRGADAGETFPDRSVCLAVTSHVPSDSAGRSHDVAGRT